jgi:hypothetical protein
MHSNQEQTITNKQVNVNDSEPSSPATSLVLPATLIPTFSLKRRRGQPNPWPFYHLSHPPNLLLSKKDGERRRGKGFVFESMRKTICQTPSSPTLLPEKEKGVASSLSLKRKEITC